ncbi:MAG: hypothetical protein IKZ09_02905 [Clostridia bacterium]|nr:hypothetical protein [Clostridia bacterium]
MPTSLHSAACDTIMMNTVRHLRRTSVLCILLLCLPYLLLGCAQSTSLLLPTAGYDYRMTAVDGAILGYPIQSKGPNPYCYSLPTEKTAPAAFSYDADNMEYTPLATKMYPLALPTGTLSVPCAVLGEGITFFASASEKDGITVLEGDIDGMAVVLSASDKTLYLADDTTAVPIARNAGGVWQVYTAQHSLLFSDDCGILYEYCGGEVTQISDGGVSDAWYAAAAENRTVIYRQLSDGSAVWYYAEDGGDPIPCVIPPKENDTDGAVYIRGTACILQGTYDRSYFYDVRTGALLDMDMGGLYRFPSQPTVDTDTLPLSPDGHFVYFDDINYIYRIDLTTADLAITFNEALIFEGACVLSSMTAVTDEIVLLSQGSNEYTEFVPTVTCAVFEEDIPEVRHEHDRIDLDYHPWDTEE